MIDLIETRNIAYKNFMKHPNGGNQQKLKDSRCNLLRNKRKAKRQWQFEFTQNCQKQSFKLNPKQVWKMVFKLMEGYQSHHRAYMPKKNTINQEKKQKMMKVMQKYLRLIFTFCLIVRYKQTKLS